MYKKDFDTMTGLRSEVHDINEAMDAALGEYLQPDRALIESSGRRLVYPEREVLAELKRAMRALDDVQVNYGDDRADRTYRFRMVGGEMYDHQRRTPAQRWWYARCLIREGEEVAGGMKTPGMRQDFLRFWEWLKANEDVLATAAPTKEPRVDIPPRKVYYVNYKGEGAIQTMDVKAIRRGEDDHSGIRIIPLHYDYTPRYETDYFGRQKLVEEEDPGHVTLAITTSLVQQIPEIRDLLATRERVQARYCTLPEEIHEAANDSLGKWLTITAI